jgi:hypothetical protein
MINDLKCPSCGAPLSIPDGEPHTILCSYCGASILLPEELHPHEPPLPEPEKWETLRTPAVQKSKTEEERNYNRAAGIAVAGIVLIMFFVMFLARKREENAWKTTQTDVARSATREQVARLTLRSPIQTAWATRFQAPFNEMATQHLATLQEIKRQVTATAAVDTATAGAAGTQEAALLQTRLVTLRAGLPTPLAWPVVFSDTFTSEGHGWPTGSVRQGAYFGSQAIQDGVYRWSLHTRTGAHIFTYPDLPPFTDGVIQAQARIHLTPELAWGIPLRVDAAHSTWYFFAVRGDGKYVFVYDTPHSTNRLVDWTASPLIDPEQNSLGVVARGNEFTLLINGQVVDTIQDDRLQSGAAGLGLLATSPNLDVQVDFTQFGLQAPP